MTASTDHATGLAVIIPVHGGVPHLADAVGPLLAQLGSGDQMVLVDNGVTGDLQGPWSLDARVRVVRSRPRAGASVARNDGVAATSTPLLVFCDSDDVAGAGYLDAMRDVLATRSMAASAVGTTLLNPHRPDLLPIHDPVWYWSDDRRWPFVGAGCLGVRRTALRVVGGFDEAIPALEDVDLCVRAAIAGIVPAPSEATMQVRYRTDPQDELDRMRAQGRASGWLERRYRTFGFPQGSRLHDLAGWVRHTAGLATPDARAREAHRRSLAWKAGLARSALDRHIQLDVPAPDAGVRGAPT